MPRFRKKAVGTKTTNYEGAEAFKETPKLELVSLLLTSFVKDKFYESGKTQLKRLSDLVKKITDKKFVGKAAVYARQEFGMRSITHALIGELVAIVKGEKWTKNAVAKTVRRPDDMLEMIGYYLGKYGKPIPNSLKKGLTLAVLNFDTYQLAKYRGERSSVKMVDLLNLVHAKPTKKMEATFKKLMAGQLKSKGTWEAKHTKAGQEVAGIEDEGEKVKELAKLKKKNWTELIKERKIGYFALLRNLRNILKDAPEAIDKAIDMLTDEHLIRRSLVLPFRFATARREIEKLPDNRKILVGLNKAIDLSLKNVPKFDGKTLVAYDQSGSMNGKPAEIGSLFAAVLYKSNDADLLIFESDAKYENVDPTDSTLTIAKRLAVAKGGTNFPAIFETANKKYDRIIILSDMQGWIEDSFGESLPNKAFTDYKKRTGADPHIYSFDLNGYGTLQFPERRVYCIAGFSDKVLDLMKALEQDKNALIKKIEAVEL